MKWLIMLCETVIPRLSKRIMYIFEASQFCFPTCYLALFEPEGLFEKSKYMKNKLCPVHMIMVSKGCNYELLTTDYNSTS